VLSARKQRRISVIDGMHASLEYTVENWIGLDWIGFVLLREDTIRYDTIQYLRSLCPFVSSRV